MFDLIYLRYFFQHVINVEVIAEIVYILFLCTKTLNSVFILYLQQISTWTSHVARAQKPLMAGGCHTGPFTSRSSLLQGWPANQLYLDHLGAR